MEGQPPVDPSAKKVHEHRLRVRYGETDQMGVVHHSNYALYLEEARTGFLSDMGWSYGELERQGIGLAVRKLELRFRMPARYEDVIVVRTRIVKVGAASIGFHYELELSRSDSRNDAPIRLAEARTELACIDLASRARGPRLLPEPLREALVGLTTDEADPLP